MGYRASTITQEREYGSTAFNDYDDFIEWHREVDGKFLDIEANEAMDFFEVEKSQLKKYAEDLARRMLQGETADTVSDHPGMSISELREVLAESIREAPGNWVMWEWF